MRSIHQVADLGTLRRIHIREHNLFAFSLPLLNKLTDLVVNISNPSVDFMILVPQQGRENNGRSRGCLPKTKQHLVDPPPCISRVEVLNTVIRAAVYREDIWQMRLGGFHALLADFVDLETAPPFVVAAVHGACFTRAEHGDGEPGTCQGFEEEFPVAVTV